MIGLLRRRSGERARYAPTPTNGSAIIQTRGLTREYHLGGETVHALRGVDVEIERNQYVAIMGPSGSGKSTLMNVIGCLDTPSAGNYWLNGHLVSGMECWVTHEHDIAAHAHRQIVLRDGMIECDERRAAARAAAAAADAA